ncbi:hypothetical protein Tdes44962_MAKER09909 [Teratosphaeria destructans]|uniref:Uncharacterized protein n=1 Tax=Teratosphaeria destructans TaxID=418781 RepID=A0A9W7SQR4_9PEZI|nr:hypothetical protein Tdes44962_MAKER09909 [Teratosphaeria destructans]
MVGRHGSHKKYAETAVCMDDLVVPTTKRDGNGREVALSEEEIKEAEDREIQRRIEETFEDLMRKVE